jgi:hypothetical protein
MAGQRFGARAVISAVMMALGLFVAIRLLVRPGDPLTTSVALDIGFAVFFFARGAIHFWTLRRRERAMAETRPPE